ncbi:retropepsin-like aspartic protease [Lutibacter sp. B1]|uniref:retropepsin-like aspartic protease n=1 Tax=Lutibacter sp. B1 TaxID=2725996 RepID=UPI00145781E8|nr:retropepsin-like aspartic protease [Lutibacter sp. B1]NLP57648.1 clan AA aspartic protease [Lutibacter sp. B1]
MKLDNILLREGYAKIKLKKINTNHFEVKAKVNGIKGRFILDTGASNSCLDIALADKFKLNVSDSDTKAAGAGAIGMETKVSVNNEIGLKKWIYKNFSIVLLDLTHVNTALTEHKSEAVDGIIGADILEKGNAIIDYKNKLLFLKKLVYKF